MNHYKRNATSIIVGIIALIILIVALRNRNIVSPSVSQVPPVAIASFEACAAAGYPIMESYPRQCRVPGGATFVEKVAPSPVVTETGIRGTAMLGPTCPVVRNPPDPKCADKPYTGSFTVFDVGGHALRNFATDTSGKFIFAISPGDYVIRQASSVSMLPRCADTKASVPASGFATVAISCDTGIR